MHYWEDSFNPLMRMKPPLPTHLLLGPPLSGSTPQHCHRGHQASSARTFAYPNESSGVPISPLHYQEWSCQKEVSIFYEWGPNPPLWAHLQMESPPCGLPLVHALQNSPLLSGTNTWMPGPMGHIRMNMTLALDLQVMALDKWAQQKNLPVLTMEIYPTWPKCDVFSLAEPPSKYSNSTL